MLDQPHTKRCPKCDTDKPHSAFHRDTGSSDGLRTSCIACQKERRSAKRAANLDKINAGLLLGEHVTRRCIKCDTVKPSGAFHRDTNNADGLNSLCKACLLARMTEFRAGKRDKITSTPATRRSGYRAAAELWPLVEDLRARVASLEALILKAPKATVAGMAPDRPRRKRTVHEPASHAPAARPATAPSIREIRTIILEEGVGPAEAKRIQDREILALSDWQQALKPKPPLR